MKPLSTPTCVVSRGTCPGTIVWAKHKAPVTNLIAVHGFSASCQTCQVPRLHQQCVITTFIKYLQHVLDHAACLMHAKGVASGRLCDNAFCWVES